MRHTLLRLIACTTTLPLVAQAAVVVSYKHPERFVDASPDFPSRLPNPRVLEGLEAHLADLGDRYLPATQTLTVEISDIDLAGEFEPTPLDPARQLRVMRELTWPRIKLHYVLSENGQTLTQGDEQLKDMNYLGQIRTGPANDSFRYEKALLDRWFMARFVAAPGDGATEPAPAAQ